MEENKTAFGALREKGRPLCCLCFWQLLQIGVAFSAIILLFGEMLLGLALSMVLFANAGWLYPQTENPHAEWLLLIWLILCFIIHGLVGLADPFGRLRDVFERCKDNLEYYSESIFK